MKTVFLISPSGYSGPEKLKNAINVLKELGFEAKYLPNITSQFHYYAGDYQRRFREINKAYKDQESEIIFCIKGGMGAVQILPFINYEEIKKSNKILIGFSDITILLNAIYQKTGKRCLHGPTFKKPLNEFDGKTINHLFYAINKKNYSIKFREKDILKSGSIKSEIVGGNLNLLERSLGTKYEIDTKNKIIFLEDVDMKDYLIYDILWQLKLAGKFDSVKGIILGYFTNCGEKVNDYLIDFFKDFKCPVIMNQPIGHDEPNITIPIGEICEIDTNKKEWRIIF